MMPVIKLFFKHSLRYAGLSFIRPLLMVGLSVACLNIYPAAAANTEISLGYLDTRIRELSHDIEELRRYMGAPRAGALKGSLNHVSTHDLFFQALAAYEKSDRLTFEILRIKGRRVNTTDGDFTVKQTIEMIQETQKSIHSILKEFELSAQVSPDTVAGDITPAQVFAALQSVNRQLNLLLERPYSPSDVYEKVTLAVGYAARLISVYPQSERIPPEPPLERDKQPGDVYLLLAGCMQILSDIYKKAGLEALEMDITGIDAETITPSDVFDLSALLVARLDYLHQRFGIKQMPRPAFYPGRRFPSDVYQRAGLLQKQLVIVKDLVQTKGMPLPRQVPE